MLCIDSLVCDISLTVLMRCPEHLCPDLTLLTATPGLLYDQHQARGGLGLHRDRDLLALGGV